MVSIPDEWPSAKITKVIAWRAEKAPWEPPLQETAERQCHAETASRQLESCQAYDVAD
jgi:hypothetical protein